MKAIQIQIEGNVASKFAAIAHEDRFCCYVSEKVANFLKAQSEDGQVYIGTPQPCIDSGRIPCDDSGTQPCNEILAYSDGSITRYYVKSAVYDNVNFFEKKEGEWEWRAIDLCVIDIME